MNPALSAIFADFLRLGLTAPRNAPAPQAVRDRALECGWTNPGRADELTAACAVLPGTDALQLCAALGRDLRGVPGALAAVCGYALPGVLALLLAGGLLHLWRGLGPVSAALPGFWAGLAAAAAATCLHQALPAVAGLRRTPLFLSVAIGVGVLFFIGLKPFAMLMGGAILGVLLLPEQPTAEAAPAGKFSWGFGLALLGGYAALAVCWFLADPALGRLFLAAGKADLYGYGGYGAQALLYADVVRARHLLEPGPFTEICALVQALPGPQPLAAALYGHAFRGLPGALAGLSGALLPSLMVLLAAAPILPVVARCDWARRAVYGLGAALAGLLLGLGGRILHDSLWSAPGAALVLAGVLALRFGLHPVLAVAGLCVGGALML
uniref:Chromate transporter n=1 Tax=Fundidesulfovibrio putealis TaxID=270496 RepID=A0A7C3W8D9_9BACT